LGCSGGNTTDLNGIVSVIARHLARLATGAKKDRVMVKFFKSSLLWQISAGFVLGTIGIVAFQPAEATRTLTSQVSIIAPFIG